MNKYMVIAVVLTFVLVFTVVCLDFPDIPFWAKLLSCVVPLVFATIGLFCRKVEVNDEL